MVLALLTLVLWAAGCAQRGILKVSWSPLYWPFLALLLIAGVQFFAGLTADHVATREALLKLITNFVFFFLAGQLLFMQPENGRVLKWWGLVVTILALGLSVLALAQVMTTGKGLIYWSVATPFGPFGPYVSANDYCGLMEMLIPIAAGYVLSGSLAKGATAVALAGRGSCPRYDCNQRFAGRCRGYAGGSPGFWIHNFLAAAHGRVASRLPPDPRRGFDLGWRFRLDG